MQLIACLRVVIDHFMNQEMVEERIIHFMNHYIYDGYNIIS